MSRKRPVTTERLIRIIDLARVVAAEYREHMALLAEERELRERFEFEVKRRWPPRSST